MQRVLKRGGRPLLDNADPEAVMKRLMDERYPVYAQADITVESTDAHHAAIVNEVLQALAQWQPREQRQDA
jgi:shikimate kinase/shikimate kinase/3-dehydroquinate synthase